MACVNFSDIYCTCTFSISSLCAAAVVLVPDDLMCHILPVAGIEHVLLAVPMLLDVFSCSPCEYATTYSWYLTPSLVQYH